MKTCAALLLLVSAWLPGCCAWVARNGNGFLGPKPEKPPTPVFGGTVTAVAWLASCLGAPVAPPGLETEPRTIALAPLIAVDIPLSFVADIICLPKDILTIEWESPRRVAKPKPPAPPPRVAGWPFDAAEAKRRQNEAAKALGVEPEQVVQIAPGVTITLVLIPAGEFIMGDPAGVQTHVIITKPFWLGKHEVTQDQYRAVMGNATSKFEGATNPAEQLTWYKTQEFLKKLNSLIGGGQFVLPTEAQWEYACRAGSASRFCFGDAYELLPQHAWCLSNSGARTHPTGTRLPNAWGIHDMHGNVAEWCQDWYVPSGEGAVKDPRGPASGTSRAVRGGAWNDMGYRGMHSPAHEAPYIGFRVARLVP
ncbi:MAG: YceK/YidQ family lipoprotein [Planctomycetes bacterium]|nr:YceK/YidQ family lipoprotein [Planctomycetota bacterium]